MSIQRQLNQGLSNDYNECPVCLSEFQKLYQLSECKHLFCQNCCIAYINSRADNFSTAKCLQQGCNSPLDEKKQIYKKLPEKTKSKIKKHELFLFIQKNPKFKQCFDQNCLGYYEKLESKQLKCNTCSKVHCNKCFRLKHLGNCVIENDTLDMGNLNYKKCPRCSVWIEKAEGCDYIDCKCGCKFCYKCGTEFDRDPCRNGKIWKNNVQVRKILKTIKIQKPDSVLEKILFLPKILLQILLSLVFTVGFSAINLTLALFLFLMISVFGPLGLLMLTSDLQGWKKTLAIGAIIVFYPLLIALFALTLAIITLLYPCLRKTYHHGVYDPFDQGLSNTSKCYIFVMGQIWSI